MMSTRVLVTFASRAGSTAGVAEAIGETLTKAGLQVDVCPMQAVNNLSPYQAIVAGSAIQDKAWLPEAIEFMESHRSQLTQKPVAVFLVCMTLAMKNQQWVEQAHVGDWLAPVRAIVTPVSEGLFAGALKLDKVPDRWARFGFRLSILFGMWAEGDHRDWAAIRTWAAALPAKFATPITSHLKENA
ncbi:MAG: flavodoxin domain-containing protein [Anaerolineae bacterium]